MPKEAHGFLADDGSFFTSAQDCELYESELALRSEAERIGLNPEEVISAIGQLTNELVRYVNARSSAPQSVPVHRINQAPIARPIRKTYTPRYDNGDDFQAFDEQQGELDDTSTDALDHIQRLARGDFSASQAQSDRGQRTEGAHRVRRRTVAPGVVQIESGSNVNFPRTERATRSVTNNSRFDDGEQYPSSRKSQGFTAQRAATRGNPAVNPRGKARPLPVQHKPTRRR